jgi:uncharacterized caspase-like protein/WD40 repeat protein
LERSKADSNTVEKALQEYSRQLINNFKGDFLTLAISFDGNYFATDKDIFLLKEQRRILLQYSDKQSDPRLENITFKSFSPDSSKFATCQDIWSANEEGLSTNFVKSKIKIWESATGSEMASFEVNDDQVGQVTFDQTGDLVALITSKKKIKILNWKTKEIIKELDFSKSENEPKSVAFNPEKKLIAVLFYQGTGIFADNPKIEFYNLEKATVVPIPELLPGWVKFFESNTATAKGRIFFLREQNRTLKIIDLISKKEIVSLFSINESDWAIITPDGRFDGSEGAQKLMHYSYGLEVIDLEQLKEMYYEPGLLPKLLGFSKEPLRSIVPLKDIKLYPEIVSQTFDEKTGKLDIKLKNRGGGIGRTEVFVNGKRVVEDARDERLRKNPNIALEAVVSLTVDLPKESFVKGKSNEIKVITSNYLKEIGKGNIQSRGTAVFYVNQEREELPNLYAIVGGVSDYDGDALDLRFAAKDAEDFSNALRLGANRLFCPSQAAECLGKIDIRTFSTARENGAEQPTKENFRKAFADIASKAKAEDIVVIYLAGHGITLGTGTDTYFYLTKEARSASKEDLEKNFQTVAVSNSELTDWLTPNSEKADDIYIKANKQVIILDTCAAGNFAGDGWKTDRDLSGDQIRAMDFLRGKTGTFILMGSAANRPSYEANRYNQGLLTRALLEGMKGFAHQDAAGNINVLQLFNYAQNRVPVIAQEMSLDQRPIIKTPSGSPFVFGQIKEEDKTKINLPPLKPLLLRPSFGIPLRNTDPLNLVQKLRNAFGLESSYEVVRSRGETEPQLVYIDDDSFPGGIKISGTYTIEAENVKVKIFFTRDDVDLRELEIVSTREKVLEDLITAVRGELAELK